MASDPREIQLTPEQRERLAALAEQSGRPWNELLETMFANVRPHSATGEGKRSLYDALQARGMVGALRGPGDLSTHPKHMEGFGKSCDRANPH